MRIVFPPPNLFQMNFYLAEICNIYNVIKVGSSVIHLWSESASQRLINDVHFIMIIWMLLTAEQSKVPGFISFTRRPTSWPQSHSKKNVPRVKFKFILKKLTSPIVFSMSHSFSNASIILHNPPIVPLFWRHLPTLVWTCCSLGLVFAGILK